jgi:hypothetical protein
VITVDYVVDDGTAELGQDYQAVSGTLSFAAGTTEQSFAVDIIDDQLNEGIETVALVLSSPSSAQLGAVYKSTLVIEDNDEPHVRFRSATYGVGEGTGEATVEIVLSWPVQRPVTAYYATVDGSALAGQDYTPRKGELIFEPGVTSLTFSVPIVDDTADEGDETVTLVLARPSYAQLGVPSEATLIIGDNDG